MIEHKTEAAVIAKLIAADETTIVGWVHRWNTGELSIMWNRNGPQRVSKLCPDLSEDDKAEIDFASLTQLPLPRDRDGRR